MAGPTCGDGRNLTMRALPLVVESAVRSQSLVRALGLYVVASWVVLQVVETLSSLFTLPDWLPGVALGLLLAGLPVVVATAFVQAKMAPARGTLLTWRRALLGGLGALALWGGVAAAWLLFGGTPVDMRPSSVASLMVPGGAAIPAPSIAVLPFETIGTDPEGEIFAAGMHDDLLTRLSHLDGLLVIARTSVLRYRGGDTPIREIGRELGVATVLEGSVQRVGGRIRVNAQLIDAGTEGHVWARTFDRELVDVLALQSELARRIADELHLRLSPAESRREAGEEEVDPDAYRHYVRGRFFWNRRTEDDIRRATQEFEAALSLDPSYARAHAGLADAYLLLPYFRAEGSADAFARARTAAGRALELNPDLADAHATLAMIRRDHEWDWPGAEAALRRALELNPGHATARQWLATTLDMLERRDEAIAQMEHAARMDPLSAVIHLNLANLLIEHGEPEAALEVARRAAELDSQLGGQALADVYLALARADEALAALDALDPSRVRAEDRAYFYARLGREQEARRITAQIAEAADRGVGSPALAALAHVALDRSAALDWLERAAEVRDPWLPWMITSPHLGALDREPRFRALRDRVFATAR